MRVLVPRWRLPSGGRRSAAVTLAVLALVVGGAVIGGWLARAGPAGSPLRGAPGGPLVGGVGGGGGGVALATVDIVLEPPNQLIVWAPQSRERVDGPSFDVIG